MEIFEMWDEFHKDCPTHNSGKCMWKVIYNQHVNDPRYGQCEWQEDCPIFFWVNANEERKDNDTEE